MKKAAGWLSVFFGTVLGIYIGIWRMLVKPLLGLYVSFCSGEVTIVLLIATAVKCWLSLTVGGLIWSIGYMIKCMLD